MAPVHVNKSKLSRGGAAAKVMPFSMPRFILFLACSTSSAPPQDKFCRAGLLMSMSTAGHMIRTIQGRRCLLVTPTPSSASPTARNDSKEPSPPPLILLGGMAQTIASWQSHMSALSSPSSQNQNRLVLAYECLGQGRRPVPFNNDDENDDDGYFCNVTLPRQAEILMSVLNEVFPSAEHDEQQQQQHQQQFDLVGFSFGGRVAMATACLYPNRIHKLHLTGVALERSDSAHLQIASWKDLLLHHDDDDDDDINHNHNSINTSNSYLRSFAWSVLLATYSPSFLRRQQHQQQQVPSSSSQLSACSNTTTTTTSRLETWIHHIRSSNDRDGLLALLQQAEIDNIEHPWHVASMADRLAALVANSNNRDSSSSSPIHIVGHVCVGALDSMAPPDEAAKLCHRLGWDAPTIVPDCGHAVALEAPRQWRSNVLDFLSSSSSD
jgi:pimeloyl-ACP methyl ester carboxylesterase